METFTVLPKDPDWTQSTNMAAHNSSSRVSDALFWPLPALHAHVAGTYTHKQNNHTHKMKLDLIFFEFKRLREMMKDILCYY